MATLQCHQGPRPLCSAICSKTCHLLSHHLRVTAAVGITSSESLLQRLTLKGSFPGGETSPRVSVLFIRVRNLFRSHPNRCLWFSFYPCPCDKDPLSWKEDEGRGCQVFPQHLLWDYLPPWKKEEIRAAVALPHEMHSSLPVGG